MGDYLIDLQGIEKAYASGNGPLPILKRIDLAIRPGEFVAVMGPSGSGKSTLLHIMGCLDKPTSGIYRFDGKDVLNAGDKELSALRSSSVGFVFQTFNLIPFLSLLENVELPFLYSDMDVDETRQRALSAIEKVGLSGRITHRPSELSGGEMQRTAIARAIAVRPKLILADEPTGNLDSHTGEGILALFKKLHAEGATIVMVTHDHQVASFAQRTYQIHDGRIGDLFH
jgi:putative ABC transport system ATP-binding protein